MHSVLQMHQRIQLNNAQHVACVSYRFIWTAAGGAAPTASYQVFRVKFIENANLVKIGEIFTSLFDASLFRINSEIGSND